MDAKLCIQTRRSVRKFQDKPIDRALIREVIALAQMAPTWRNSQTVRYWCIDDPALKAQIAQSGTLGFAKNADNIKNAPVLMVVTSVNGICGYNADGSFSSALGRHWESFDAGLGVQTLCLALHEAGLGSVIMGLFDPEIVARLAGIPENQSVACILAVGYPADGDHGNPARKPLDEVLTFR